MAKSSLGSSASALQEFLPSPCLMPPAHFLAKLTSEQRSKAQFQVDDPEWRRWGKPALLAPSGGFVHGTGRGATRRRVRP